MSTATITAQDINKLRQATGAGMMDCRKALTETNGDFEGSYRLAAQARSESCCKT